MALNPGAGKVSFGFKKADASGSSSGAASSSTSAKPAVKPFGFSLGGALSKPQAKGKDAPAPPPRTLKPAVFADAGDADEDEDGAELGAAPGPSSGSAGRPKAKPIISPFGQGKAAPASMVEKKVQEKALDVDASIFDYDAAYDRMQQAKQAVQARKDAEKEVRKPKYISGLFETAELRKRDHARAEAKKYQREREAEGDEYAGTEAFVTEAYREHLEEIKRLEEKEAKEEEQQRSKAKAGGASFFKDMMKAQDADHLAVMQAATAATDKGKGKASEEEIQSSNTAASEAPRKKSDLELARDARARGLRAELNEEGELVDKRDVLGKGLNIIRSDADRDKGSKDMNLVRNRAGASGSSAGGAQHGFDDRASHDQRRAQRARQTRLIEEQMMEQERKRLEEEEREREERRKKLTGIASEEDARKREEKVSAARERALERKRKREEEQKAGAAGAAGGSEAPS